MRYEFHQDKPITNCPECPCFQDEYDKCGVLTTVRVSFDKRPVDCPLKEFRERKKPYRTPPKPPWDHNCLKTLEDCIVGMRVVTNGNNGNHGPGQKGTVIQRDKYAIEQNFALVLFDAVDYYQGRSELNRTVYMWPTSLNKLEK